MKGPDQKERITPFLKWAGGKRWLVHSYHHLLPSNSACRRYIEPFLGSGAVFFNLQPQRALLADINPDLIETYEVVRDNCQEIRKLLKEHHKKHCASHYYTQRKTQYDSKIKRAARFIYLNRTCWNGLYRVNLKGEFNVPIGTKTSVILGTDCFEEISKCLKKVEFNTADFASTLAKARKGDFVFIDPPYTINHNINGFRKYNERIFKWSDQIRLRDLAFCAKRRGAQVLILNADHDSIRDLYTGFGEMATLQRHSVLAGNSAFRKSSSELAIMSEVFC